MKKLVFIWLYLFLAFNYAGAQEQLSIRQMADRLYDRYEYFKSVKLYLKLVKKTNTDVRVLERIADCYRNINRYDEAEQWYARVAANARASSISHYNYAEVLLREQKFDLARQQYKIYFGNDKGRLAEKLAACDSAVLWMGEKPAYKVTNVAGLNTEYSDWGLNYEGKSNMVFTSDRLVDDGVDNRTGNNWFRLYETDSTGSNIKAFVLTGGAVDISAGKYHTGPAAFNSGADTAYITIATNMPRKELPVDNPDKTNEQKLYTRRLAIIIAVKKDGVWEIAGSFPYDDVQRYSVADAALSPDGRVIYFVSDMPGGEGKTDIWYSEKQTDGSWGRPLNCGKTINTPEEDDFPATGGDGALYYSSKGLAGMGGYDIYRAKGEKARWTKPQNLKYPVNSTSDDFYLLTKNGKSGYFSSNRDGGKGSDDIYRFVFEPDDTVPLKKLITHTDTSNIKPSAPLKTPENFVLTTIYYDLDKSFIRPDAIAPMDKLVLLLKQQPQLKVEISSYTDSRASYRYNMALSQRRAAAAVDYLVKRGIPAARLVARFYGETHLVNKCGDNVQCSEAEHQLNRRTEFRVIGGGD